MSDHEALVATVAEALAAVPAKYSSPDPALLSKLPKPTNKNNPKGRCDECGGWHGLPAIHLDYMGHADVTLALIAIDPMFDYGWLTNPDGSMLIGRPDTNRLVLQGWLTVHGVQRLCVGTCEANKGEPEKELIGDLLRNGAMRFGVATALWSKSDAHESVERDAPDQPPPPVQMATEDEVLGDAAANRVREVIEADPGAVTPLRAFGGKHGKGFSGEALSDPVWRALVLAELASRAGKEAAARARASVAEREQAADELADASVDG